MWTEVVHEVWPRDPGAPRVIPEGTALQDWYDGGRDRLHSDIVRTPGLNGAYMHRSVRQKITDHLWGLGYRKMAFTR